MAARAPGARRCHLAHGPGALVPSTRGRGVSSRRSNDGLEQRTGFRHLHVWRQAAMDKDELVAAILERSTIDEEYRTLWQQSLAELSIEQLEQTLADLKAKNS